MIYHIITNTPNRLKAREFTLITDDHLPAYQRVHRNSRHRMTVQLSFEESDPAAARLVLEQYIQDTDQLRKGPSYEKTMHA